MLVEFLARKWAVNNEVTERPDAIVMVAHGATKNRLTFGSWKVRWRTQQLVIQWPNTLVYFGSFTESIDPEVEVRDKNVFTGSVYIGKVLTTIEECLAFRTITNERALPLKHVVVVTDEAHSRRCGLVWRTLLPGVKISIVSVPLKDAVDTESPMESYHGALSALFFQAAPYPFFWCFALGGEKSLVYFASKLHQPISSR